MRYNVNMIQMQSSNSSFAVEQHGARLTMTLCGLQVLVSLDNTRFDQKVGSTHPCSPNFGPYGKEYGLSQHGPARNAEWVVRGDVELRTNNKELRSSGDQGRGTSEMELRKKDQAGNGQSIELSYEIQNPGYPDGVIITQKFELIGDVFRLTTTHENTGRKPAPVVFGEHLYWVSPQGWDNVLLNGNNVSKEINGDTLIEIPEVNEVTIPGHAIVRLVQEGMGFAKLWSMPQGDGTHDTHYFCFEPIENDEKLFGKPETMIEPGDRRTCWFTLELK